MFKTLKNLIISEKVVFVEKRQEAHNAWTFVFEKPKRNYKAGQHFIFILNHENKDNRKAMRVFSISSAPYEDTFTFTTRYFGDLSSSFKQALFNMQPGEEIKILGPSPIMDVYKVKDFTQPYVFIAGGIGITPFHGLIKDAVHQKHNLRGTLYYCNKDQDFIFNDELENLIAQLDTFSLIKVVSPERITADQLNEQFAIMQNPQVKISGTIGFVENYENLIKNETNTPKGNIKAYKYKGLVGGYK